MDITSLIFCNLREAAYVLGYFTVKWLLFTSFFPNKAASFALISGLVTFSPAYVAVCLVSALPILLRLLFFSLTNLILSTYLIPSYLLLLFSFSIDATPSYLALLLELTVPVYPPAFSFSYF